LVEAFVTAVVAHRSARAELARETLLIDSQRADTDVRVHPLAAEIRQQARLIRDIGASLGLTPQSRLTLLSGNQDDDLQTPFGPFEVISGGRKS
jgi:phage terminase small subunit